MQSKTIIKVATVAVLCVVSFWLGRLSVTRNTVIYPVNGNRIAVHLDWPTYGLPLAEYESALSILRSGDTNHAIMRLEAFLDEAIYDAERRRPLLRAESLTEFDKSLVKVARYREQFPRFLDQSTNRFWAERQAGIDGFLHSISKQ